MKRNVIDYLKNQRKQMYAHQTNHRYKITIRAEGVVLTLPLQKKIIIHPQNMVVHHIMMVGLLF